MNNGAEQTQSQPECDVGREAWNSSPLPSSDDEVQEVVEFDSKDGPSQHETGASDFVIVDDPDHPTCVDKTGDHDDDDSVCMADAPEPLN